MRKRRKAELARLGEVAARLEAELAGVATEVRHTQALHDEFRTAAFAAWSAEVERLTTEFGERFSSAFEGIQELQGLSNALEGKVNTVLYDLDRTGSDVSDLSGRLDLAATAEQLASAFEGIAELQTLSSGLQGQVNAVQTDLERTGSDVSALAKDMEAVGGLTKDVSALAKQSEKDQGRFSETVTTVAEQATRFDTLAGGLAAIQRSLAAATTSMTSTTSTTA